MHKGDLSPHVNAAGRHLARKGRDFHALGAHLGQCRRIDGVDIRGEGHFAAIGALDQEQQDRALATLLQGGERAVLLFLIQRADCGEMALAADIDPVYASALTQVRAQGVEITAFSCQISSSGIDVGREIAFIHP